MKIKIWVLVSAGGVVQVDVTPWSKVGMRPKDRQFCVSNVEIPIEVEDNRVKVEEVK